MQADDPRVLAYVKEGLDLVEIVARQIRRQFGPYVDKDELVSQGRESLFGAARSFDETRGVPFRRWANLRIRGSMIDSLRQHGNLPKRVYKKLRAMQAADQVHASMDEDATPPASPEDADAKVGARLDAAAMAMAMSFLARRTSDALEHAKDDGDSPEEAVSRAELVTLVRNALSERPEEERLVIERHYFEEIRLDDIAKELGVSKSWASRLHTRAVEAIARAMKRAAPPR